MEGYQNILCATDFSQHSQDAAKRAAELAQFYDAQLTLLHVVEYFPEDRSNEQIASEDADPMRFREQEVLESMTKLLQQTGIGKVKREIRFSSHSARHEIIRYAEEQKVDLIVVASHGHHGITALLGSTSNGIVHGSPCDVVVVRAHEK